jgi:hypothetical protein
MVDAASLQQKPHIKINLFSECGAVSKQQHLMGHESFRYVCRYLHVWHDGVDVECLARHCKSDFVQQRIVSILVVE